MKIIYKKKRLYLNLIIGLFWTFFGIFNLLEDGNSRWIDYGYLVIGILYFGQYLLKPCKCDLTYTTFHCLTYNTLI